MQPRVLGQARNRPPCAKMTRKAGVAVTVAGQTRGGLVRRAPGVDSIEFAPQRRNKPSRSNPGKSINQSQACQPRTECGSHRGTHGTKKDEAVRSVLCRRLLGESVRVSRRLPHDRWYGGIAFPACRFLSEGYVGTRYLCTYHGRVHGEDSQ